MFVLVIKEKPGIVGGWLETDGEQHEIPFGDFEEDVERATELLAVWSDWMEKEIDSVQDITNGMGEGVSLKPSMVQSIGLFFTRS